MSKRARTLGILPIPQFPNFPISPSVSWQRNLAVLWIGQLIAAVGFSVTLPFLPYFVQELGITGVDRVAFWAGLVTSTQATTMALMAPVWGSLSDRYGRKIMVVRAMLGGSLTIGAMGFVGNVYQLVVLRAIQGLFTGTVSAATTLVASSTPPQRRGYAIGLLQMALYLGHSAGPLLGGFVADTLGYRPAFWVTGGLLFVAGMLVTVGVHEEFTPPEESDQTTTAARTPRLWDGLLLVLHTRPLMAGFGIRVLMRTAANVMAPILPLFIQQIADPGVKIASLAGTMAGVASVTSAGAAILLGRVSDRIGARRVLLTCGIAACLLYGAQAWVDTPTQLLLLRAGGGAATGGILASVGALLAELAPKDRFGAVYGVDTSMVAAANALAPMIGAALTASWGLTAPFIGSAALYAAATVVVATVVPGTKARQPDPESA
jgi:DHA1 family multidrug resistance protein-like MFS transporter